MNLSNLNKNFLFTLLICFISFSSFTFNQVKNDLRNDILVFIKPGVLDFPSDEKGSISLYDLNIYSTELLDAFLRIKLEGICKAFPHFTEENIVRITEDGEVVKLSAFLSIYGIRLKEKTDIDFAIEELSKLEEIVFAEKNLNAELFNDPTYNIQWHLNNTGQSGGTSDADIDAPEAWQIFTGSSSTKIGIFDSGVEQTHDEFYGKVLGDAPDATGLDPYWSHGTHVAGISGAKANNNKWGVQSLPVIVLLNFFT